jgi:hypothetical protein
MTLSKKSFILHVKHQAEVSGLVGISKLHPEQTIGQKSPKGIYTLVLTNAGSSENYNNNN